MISTILTFLYKNIKTRKLIRLFYRLKRRNMLDVESNSKYQRDKLNALLRIAFDGVPFYKKLNLNPDLSTKDYNEFTKLPLIDKEIIRNNIKSLINSNFDLATDRIYQNTSGGSTGEPVVLYRTGFQANCGGANYFYALINNGVSIYQKSVDLWGAERDMYKGEEKVGLRQLMHNNVMLNTFVLSDSIIENYIKKLNKIRPHFIKAYVHSIYEIAKYVLSNSISLDFTPIIHCTTGPLYPEMRDVISKAFNNARVYNYYGSREVSGIASEVLGSHKMYTLYDNVFVEILDDNGEPVNQGEEGEIVITTLNNFYMPLIRYRIGDRGVKGDNLEFGSLILEKVVGRTLGVIHRKDGMKIDGQFFTTLFFGKEGIKSFQLIQKSMDRLVLKIVKTSTFKEDELNSVIARIVDELGEVSVVVDFCEKIDLSSTGKVMYVYSEL